MNQSQYPESKGSFSSLYVTIPLLGAVFLVMWCWFLNEQFVRAQTNWSSPAPVTITIVGANPCENPNATLQAVLISTSGTAATQIIAVSGSTKIYPCSLNVVGVSGTTPTFSLVYGTGTNCATGQTVFLGAWTTTANTVYPFVKMGPTPASQALCYLDGGTTPIQRVSLSYVQQ